MPVPTLQEQFGQIDIYLFDQLLKGRISPGMRILDAGCGSGRNIVYFLRQGYEVYAVDADAHSVDSVRSLARIVAPALPDSNLRVEVVERMSFGDSFADVVINNTVLHFARDEQHWHAMVNEMWRVLAPGGILFARLATTVGQPRLQPLGGGRYVQPDGDTRFLVDHEQLIDVTAALRGSLLDPLKSSVVHDRRSMGTWVVRKASR